MNIVRSLLVGVLIALLLAVCVGCSNGGDAPTEVVKKVVEGWKRFDDESSKYYCKEYEKWVRNEFSEEAEEMGLSLDDFKQIVEYQFTDMKYEEKSREGGKAIVHITGSAKRETHGDKYKELVIKTIEARGETISDEELEILDAWARTIDMLSEEIEVKGDVKLIKEDGKWKLCDNLSNAFDFTY